MTTQTRAGNTERVFMVKDQAQAHSERLSAKLRAKVEAEDFFNIRQDFVLLLEHTERLERDMGNMRAAFRNLKKKLKGVTYP
jgi:hypothetical protein